MTFQRRKIFLSKSLNIFAEHAWYFRNALVRVNYNDLKNGVYETTEYLEMFLRNLFLNENHPRHNRAQHTAELKTGGNTYGKFF